MIIENEEQKKQVLETLEMLVNALESYDRRHQFNACLKGFSDINNTNKEHIEAARLQYEANLQKRFDHYVKGSLDPVHPLDDSGPRGYVFFRSLEW